MSPVDVVIGEHNRKVDAQFLQRERLGRVGSCLGRQRNRFVLNELEKRLVQVGHSSAANVLVVQVMAFELDHPAGAFGRRRGCFGRDVLNRPSGRCRRSGRTRCTGAGIAAVRRCLSGGAASGRSASARLCRARLASRIGCRRFGISTSFSYRI